MTAVRLSFTWFGTRKTLSQEQKAEAADAFGADGPFLSAGKKLLEKLGATVTEGAEIVVLAEPGGSQRVRDSGLALFTLVHFDGH
jgi:adenine/guanine phosphoribosyltransferase-like PRPP-binding protein